MAHARGPQPNALVGHIQHALLVRTTPLQCGLGCTRPRTPVGASDLRGRSVRRQDKGHIDERHGRLLLLEVQAHLQPYPAL